VDRGDHGGMEFRSKMGACSIIQHLIALCVFAFGFENKDYKCAYLTSGVECCRLDFLT